MPAPGARPRAAGSLPRASTRAVAVPAVSGVPRSSYPAASMAGPARFAWLVQIVRETAASRENPAGALGPGTQSDQRIRRVGPEQAPRSHAMAHSCSGRSAGTANPSRKFPDRRSSHFRFLVIMLPLCGCSCSRGPAAPESFPRSRERGAACRSPGQLPCRGLARRSRWHRLRADRRCGGPPACRFSRRWPPRRRRPPCDERRRCPLRVPAGRHSIPGPVVAGGYARCRCR